MNEHSRSVQFSTLTGKLPGAIATTAVWGVNAADVIAQVFLPQTKSAPESWPLNSIRYGKWRFDREPIIDAIPPINNVSGESLPGEDLVVSRIADDYFEIQSHAGFAVAVIQSSLRWAGAIEAPPREFARQQSNRWVAEIESALALATTQRGSLILLHQWWLWQTWGPQVDRLPVNPLVIATIQSSLAWSRFGRHLTQPFEVVFFGQPNVGKSSLINACLGFNRSIVHEQPGTTRDVVTQTTAIDGWLVNLSDTAGIRDASDTIEATGIAYAQQQMVNADCLVSVVDATQSQLDGLPSSFDELTVDLCVHNKSDLVPTKEISGDAILTSTRTGQGIPDLLSAIGKQLVPVEPPPELPIPVTPSMVEWLKARLSNE